MFPKDYAELNTGRLQNAIDDGRISNKAPITEDMLLETGIVSKSKDGVRLLGKGAITSKVELIVAGATASAVAAVEKAGGKVTILDLKKEEAA
jgi:large subunit ribosomal protein L15